ncbi:MAG TPA: ABC transporter substrate-binding protein [Burkholderiales bacterium]|nr:ABC transporter substrate-binding protein [Burkholderiales bacterium]
MAAPAQKVRVVVFEGVQNLPIFVAQERGAFAARGLELELTFTPNSWTLRDGLAAGTYDIAHTAVDNAIAMAELAGKDIAIVMGGDSGWNAIIAQPGVERIEALRGRKVLVDAPNTAFALVMYKVLALHGMQRADYEGQSVGATPLRLKAMQEDRSAAATIMNLPFRVLAERAGLRKLGEATSFIGPYLATACFVMRPWGEANSDLLVRYIQAYVEGLRFGLSDPEYSVRILSERLKLDSSVARDAHAIATAPGGFAVDAALDLAGLQNVLKLRAEVEGQWGGVAPAPDRYLDLTYYERALKAL